MKQIEWLNLKKRNNEKIMVYFKRYIKEIIWLINGILKRLFFNFLKNYIIILSILVENYKIIFNEKITN